MLGSDLLGSFACILGVTMLGSDLLGSSAWVFGVRTLASDLLGRSNSKRLLFIGLCRFAATQGVGDRWFQELGTLGLRRGLGRSERERGRETEIVGFRD